MGRFRCQLAGVVSFVFLSLLNTVPIAANPTTAVEAEIDSHLLALDGLPDCAVRCLLEHAQDSGCSLQAVDCLCPHDEDEHFAHCLLDQCSVADQQKANVVATDFCGALFPADDQIVPVFAIFISLTLVVVSLRIFARVLTKAYFWWDDLFNLLALGGCIAFTAIGIMQVDYGFGMDIWWARHHHVTLVLKLFYVDMLLYTITRFFVRSSIILFYLRVFPALSETNIRPRIIWTMVANVGYNLSFLVVVIFQCQPISYFWMQMNKRVDPGKCFNVTALAWAAAGTGILFDFWLLLLPFPQLWALNVHWKKKAMGAFMFCVGLSVVIISLVRLKTINAFTLAKNPTKDVVDVCMWSGIEIDLGVICPCLFSCRLLLRKMWPRLVGSEDNSRHRLRSRSNTLATQSTGSGVFLRRASTLKGIWSTGREGSGNWNGDWDSGSGNIIRTTELNIQFEPASPTSVASPRGRVEGFTSVSTIGSMEWETLQLRMHHYGHERANGPGTPAVHFNTTIFK